MQACRLICKYKTCTFARLSFSTVHCATLYCELCNSLLFTVQLFTVHCAGGNQRSLEGEIPAQPTGDWTFLIAPQGARVVQIYADADTYAADADAADADADDAEHTLS